MSREYKNMCMYENHYFNNKTCRWERLNISRLCFDKNCNRKHNVKRLEKTCPLNTKCAEAGIICFLLHDLNSMSNNCKYGKNCCDLKCPYRHNPGRQNKICPLSENCPDALITCFLLHDLGKIIPLCRYNKDCINYMCDKRHNKERLEPCPDGSMCYKFIVSKNEGCPLLHPKILQKLCKWDFRGDCKTYGCSFIHSPDSAKDCPNGMQCQSRILEDDNLRCKNKHPKFTSVFKIRDKYLFE